MKIMNKYLTLILILLLLACGGFCGTAAAEDDNETETGISDDTGAYLLPDIIVRLTGLSTTLNTTADALYPTGEPDTALVSAELDTLILDMQTLMTEMQGRYPVSESTLSGARDIITNLQTTSLALQEESPDLAPIAANLTKASTDIVSMNDTFLTLLTMMGTTTNMDDALVIADISNQLSGFSSDLNAMAEVLIPAAPDTVLYNSELLDAATELQTLHDILQNDPAVPDAAIQNLAAVTAEIRVSADDLLGYDPDLPVIAANLHAESAELSTVADDLSAALLPSPESTQNETGSPTDTQDNTGLIIAVIAGLGGLVIIIGGFILMKKMRNENTSPAKNMYSNVPKQELKPKIRKEGSVLPAAANTGTVLKSEEEPVSPEVVNPDAARKSEPKNKTVPANLTPSEYYALIAASIAENHGIMKSTSLAPGDLLRITEYAPQMQEYVDLYERVRYSGHYDKNDIARLEQLAKRILENNS